MNDNEKDRLYKGVMLMAIVLSLFSLSGGTSAVSSAISSFTANITGQPGMDSVTFVPGTDIALSQDNTLREITITSTASVARVNKSGDTMTGSLIVPWVNDTNGNAYLKNTTVFGGPNVTLTKNPNGSINIDSSSSSIFSHVQIVNGSRNVGSVYQNTHSTPMHIVISGNGANGYLFFRIGSTSSVNSTIGLCYSNNACYFTTILPSNWYYLVVAGVPAGDLSNVKYWMEEW